VTSPTDVVLVILVARKCDKISNKWRKHTAAVQTLINNEVGRL